MVTHLITTDVPKLTRNIRLKAISEKMDVKLETTFSNTPVSNTVVHNTPNLKGAPHVSILKGLLVQENGKIENNKGKVVGQLIEREECSAKKCYFIRYLCDEYGNIKDFLGKVVARAKVVTEN